MMEITLNLLRDVLIAIGVLATLVSSIGINRFPDFFSRIHAAGISDTVGIGFVIAGLFIETGFGLNGLKLLMILVFVLLTSPVSSHALAKAAIHGGLLPVTKKLEVNKHRTCY